MSQTRGNLGEPSKGSIKSGAHERLIEPEWSSTQVIRSDDKRIDGRNLSSLHSSPLMTPPRQMKRAVIVVVFVCLFPPGFIIIIFTGNTGITSFKQSIINQLGTKL
jgi:hypothetical protein